MAASKRALPEPTELEKAIALAEKDFERAQEILRRAERVWVAEIEKVVGDGHVERLAPEVAALYEAIRDYRKKLSALVTLDEQKTKEDSQRVQRQDPG